MSLVKFVDRNGRLVPPEQLYLEIKDSWTGDFKDQVILDYLLDEDFTLDNLFFTRSRVEVIVEKNACKCGKGNAKWMNPDGSWVCQDCELW